MSGTPQSRPADGDEPVQIASGSGGDRVAARAAAKLAGAAALLAGLALAACAFVVLRLIETWRVTPHAASHHISILGHRLTYPTANAAALVVLALAAIGLIVAARGVGSAIREATASRRFTRGLAAGRPGQLKDALLLDDEQPHAFCAGLFRPQVYVTTGAAAILDEQALEAVLVHERHHARRRDPCALRQVGSSGTRSSSSQGYAGSAADTRCSPS